MSAKSSRKKAVSRKGLINTRKPDRTRSRSATKNSARPRTASKRKAKSSKKKVTGSDGSIVVRIMGRGQFRLDRATAAELNQIDNQIVKLVDSALGGGSTDSTYDSRFRKMLEQMAQLVTRRGKEVGEGERVPSDLILPPADISIDEARELFKEEGLLPG